MRQLTRILSVFVLVYQFVPDTYSQIANHVKTQLVLVDATGKFVGNVVDFPLRGGFATNVTVAFEMNDHVFFLYVDTSQNIHGVIPNDTTLGSVYFTTSDCSGTPYIASEYVPELFASSVVLDEPVFGGGEGGSVYVANLDFTKQFLTFLSLRGGSTCVSQGNSSYARPAIVLPNLVTQWQRPFSVQAAPATVVDLVPPTTTAIRTPGPNNNGWNNSTVNINLSAVDNPGGTGVKQISYVLSGAQTGSTVVGGSNTSVGISIEGLTSLSYFATDNAGNQETPKALTVQIDKTAPVISGMPTGCTLWPPDQKLVTVATVTAADALSGLAPGSFNVTGMSSEPVNDPRSPDIVITANGAGGFVVQLRADRLGSGNGRIYTLNATANDLAGNTATVTVSCTVPQAKT
jgi:hypothetical protein